MSARDAMETLWAERGVDRARVVLRSDGTVGDAARADATRASLGRTGAEAAVALPDASDELALGAELGRGGRGVVVIAAQRSLQRDIAVKRAFEPGLGDLELVEEAWALAHLAHPNVVPVHALGMLDGRPAMAMKRIVGEPWSARLARRDPADDPSDEVRVLLDVARAVEHAHEESVLHLDLKPANVMLGAFGEVYVLDWGLAARTGDTPTFLPLARDVSGPAGTPAYMAPEQARGDAGALTPATDVYLLGAILYEILTGRPPHPGNSVYVRMFHAACGEPLEVPGRVPSLDRIASKATAHEPADRYADVRSLRVALETYLREREGERLLAIGLEALQQLTVTVAPRPADRAAVDERFGAARFALREALRELSGRADAVDALQTLHATMARFTLGEGELALARTHVEALAPRDPALDAALTEAERAQAEAVARRRHLEGLGRDHDLAPEHTLRARTVGFLATVFLISNLVLGALDRAGHPVSYDELGVAIGIGAVLTVGVGVTLRRAHFPNRAGAAIWGVCIALVVPVLAHWAVGAALDLPFRSMLSISPVYYMACLSALATYFDARVWPAVGLTGLGALGCAVWPSAAYELIGVSGFLALWQIATAWRRTV